MRLQEKKEKKAQEFSNSNIQMISAMPLMAIKKAFISGFDEADPIGFMEWVWRKSFYYFDTSNLVWKDTTLPDEYTITIEEVYLKFLEYKQTKTAEETPSSQHLTGR